MFILKDGETAVALGSTASVYYPANEYEVAGNNVMFVMPNGVEADDDFGAINPMAGVITGEAGSYAFELKNIANVLRVNVTADVDINSVTLDYGSMAYFAQGGKFYVDAAESKMTYAEISTSANDETVSLKTPGNTADVLFIIPTISFPIYFFF